MGGSVGGWGECGWMGRSVGGWGKCGWVEGVLAGGGDGGERRSRRERKSYLSLKVFRLICLWCTPEQPSLGENTEVKQDYANGIKRKGKNIHE